METKDIKRDQQPVNIYMEANPNPNSLKFVVNRMLLPDGQSMDFPDKESAADAPLAQELFNYSYVDRVFYMSNFVTVTKKDDVLWEEVRNELKKHIQEYLEANKPVVNQIKEEPLIDENDSETVKQIKGILDEYVRPAVEGDGGAITFHSYKDGIVTVLLQGSCSGCPSSTVTLKAGIENLLKRMLPEIKGVEAENV